MVSAAYFDGRSTQRRTAQLTLEAHALVLHQGDEIQRYDARQLSLPEPSAGIARPIGLPDGGTLWLPAEAAAQWLPRLRRAAGQRRGAATLIASWPAVALCLVLLVATLWWVNDEGAGLAARAVLPLVPRTVDQNIGEQAWPAIEKRWLAPLPDDARCQRLSVRFLPIAQRFYQGQLRLSCHRTQEGSGFNAFALPDGHIVILKGLLDVLDDDEVIAVLGHELGHVVHRHTMQALVRSTGLVAAAGVVLGDFSAVAVTATSTLQGLAYSRDAEREADAFALRFLAMAGLQPVVLSRVWRKFADEEQRSGGGVPPWLSSHPATEERLRVLEGAR